jgi:hypothetical protein
VRRNVNAKVEAMRNLTYLTAQSAHNPGQVLKYTALADECLDELVHLLRGAVERQSACVDLRTEEQPSQVDQL